MNLLSILLIILLLLLSAVFSASEIAFNTSNKIRIKKAAENGSKTAKMVISVTEHFTSALSAILIGNNLVNIASSTVATTLFFRLLGTENAGVSSVVSTVVMTFFVLIFGEIVPKVLAREHADTVAAVIAYPTRILTVILSPVIFPILFFIRGLQKLWGRDQSADSPTVTEEELSSIIDTVEEEGVIDEDKSDLLQSTLEFPDTSIEEIMTPRIDMTVIDIDDDPESITQIIEESRYSRIPVYEDSIDNIIGILVLNHYYCAVLEAGHAITDLRPLLMEPCFAHKTMKLPAALSLMREKKMHLVVITDEFGGTMGVVSMEDVLEELVGDIWDESDEVINLCTKTGENTYDVSGDMNIDDFFEEIDFYPSDFECEYTTMGGWAVEMLNADPHVGDSFLYEHLCIVVSEMDDRRVLKLTVLVNKKDGDEEDDEDS